MGNWNEAGIGYLSGPKNCIPHVEELGDFHLEMNLVVVWRRHVWSCLFLSFFLSKERKSQIFVISAKVLRRSEKVPLPCSPAISLELPILPPKRRRCRSEGLLGVKVT